MTSNTPVTTRAAALASDPSARRRRSRLRRSLADARLDALYLPALLLFVTFMLVPLFYGLRLSFQNWDGFSPTRSDAGLANYLRLFTDSAFLIALRNTLLYGVVSTIIQQVLGLLLAVALDRPARSSTILRAVIYLPVLISPIIMGAMYALMLQYNNGALNDIVGLFGVGKHAWLSNGTTAVWVIIIIHSLQFTGTTMIIYLAGLQGIDANLQEAASIDGASTGQRFFSITLPLLQPAFATSLTLNLIGGLKVFDLIQILTNGGPGNSTHSLSSLISDEYFNQQSAGYSSAMGVALFIIIVIFSLGVTRVLNATRRF